MKTHPKPTGVKKYTYDNLPCPSLQRQAEAKYDACENESSEREYGVKNGKIVFCEITRSSKVI